MAGVHIAGPEEALTPSRKHAHPSHSTLSGPGSEMLQNWGLQLISFPLQINDVAFAQEIAALLGVGIEVVVRPYGRAQELEADRQACSRWPRPVSFL